MAANLATLLPTDQIRLSSWQSADVSVEVYVAIERFDVDTRGKGVLDRLVAHPLSRRGEDS